VPSGWCADENGGTYPAPPWQLQGELYASLWRVPARSFSASAPSGFRPVTLFGQILVGTAWAHYEPGGVLAYNEVLAACRVRGPDGTATHVPLIWVDHPSSAAGACALWGIPKRLATFSVTSTRAAFEAAADVDGQAIASVRFHPHLRLPGRWPLQTRLAHCSPDGMKLTRARLSARVTFGSTKWQFAPEGPLAFLACRTPLLSVRFSEMVLVFGLPG
jgi:Acetoacetate decarboxylase (ADC)